MTTYDVTKNYKTNILNYVDFASALLFALHIKNMLYINTRNSERNTN